MTTSRNEQSYNQEGTTQSWNLVRHLHPGHPFTRDQRGRRRKNIPSCRSKTREERRTRLVIFKGESLLLTLWKRPCGLSSKILSSLRSASLSFAAFACAKPPSKLTGIMAAAGAEGSAAAAAPAGTGTGGAVGADAGAAAAAAPAGTGAAAALVVAAGAGGGAAAAAAAPVVAVAEGVAAAPVGVVCGPADGVAAPVDGAGVAPVRAADGTAAGGAVAAGACFGGGDCIGVEADPPAGFVGLVIGAL